MARILALLTGLWAAAAIAAPAANPGLDGLMSLLAKRKHGEVTFIEKDYLGVLDRPLTSSGVLVYDAPDRLEKKTLHPREETIVLDHGVMTVQRGRRTYHLDLSSYPQMAPYVDAVRATMAGDRAALERVFEVNFEGTLQHWDLTLVPLDEQIARGVRSIRIEGAEADLRSVEIEKPNGDRSVMTIGAPAPEGSPAK